MIVFTGIVEAMGTVVSNSLNGASLGSQGKSAPPSLLKRSCGRAGTTASFSDFSSAPSFASFRQGGNSATERDARHSSGRLVVSCPFAHELSVGQSVSVSGVCLTVVSCELSVVSFDVVEETLKRTYLWELVKGDMVNLERAMRVDGLNGALLEGVPNSVLTTSLPPELGTPSSSAASPPVVGSFAMDCSARHFRLDGHIVQGHIDGVGELIIKNVKRKNELDEMELVIEVKSELMKYVVEKGSICVDGVSLTVVSLNSDESDVANELDKGWFSVAVVPHTLQVTNLGQKKVGDKVHVEVDILAKYVEKLAGSR